MPSWPTSSDDCALQADWLDRITRARRSGDHLTAFDMAARALIDFPDVPAFGYEAVLALLNAHADDYAETQLEQLEANGLPARADVQLAADFATLRPRTLKQKALNANGMAR